MERLKVLPSNYYKYSNIINSFRNLKEENLNFESLHKDILRIFKDVKEPNKRLYSFEKTLNSSKEYHRLKNKLYVNNMLKYKYCTKKNENLCKKADEFFSYFNNLDQTIKDRLSRRDMFSLFFTYIGVIPSCLQFKYMKDIVIYDNPNNIFNGYMCMDYVYSDNLVHIFNPEDVLKVAKRNKDIFGDVRTKDEVIKYLADHPIRNYYPDNEYKSMAEYYQEQFEIGLILGIPKTEIFKYVCFMPDTRELQSFQNINYDYTDDDYELYVSRADNYNHNTEIVNQRKEKLNRYTPKNKRSEKAIEISSNKNEVYLDVKYRESDYVFNEYFYNREISLYIKQISKILEDTKYYQNINKIIKY